MTKDKQVMDSKTVVHDIFCNGSEDDKGDWNRSDEKDTTMQEDDSFTTDRLTVEQEGKKQPSSGRNQCCLWLQTMKKKRTKKLKIRYG